MHQYVYPGIYRLENWTGRNEGTVTTAVSFYEKISFPIYKFLKMGYNVRKVNMEVDNERAEIKDFF